MGAIKVPTTFNIDVEFEIPEFYKRLVAVLIDILILFFYFKIAREIMLSIARSSDLGTDTTGDTYLNLRGLWIVFHAPVFLYYPVLEITMNGQTVGKKIMGIRVVNENGGRPGFSQFMIRWLLCYIWFLMMFLIASQNTDGQHRDEATFIILFVMAYFITDVVLVVSSKKGQRLGDLLAHTILINTNARTRIEETVFQEVSENYTPVFSQIMQLSDKDINAIKSILETARKKGDFHMAATASEKIKAHLKIDSTMSPFDFLEVLLKDYNYLSVRR